MIKKIKWQNYLESINNLNSNSNSINNSHPVMSNSPLRFHLITKVKKIRAIKMIFLNLNQEEDLHLAREGKLVMKKFKKNKRTKKKKFPLMLQGKNLMID